MNIVIDASVIIAVLANEPQKDKLIQLTQGKELIAPASVHWEIGNAFSAMLKRKRIEIHQIQKALTAYQQIPIRFLAIELDESLFLANQYQIYAYDAYLLRCAIKYQSPLLTLDLALSQKAKQNNIDVLEVNP